MTLCTVYFKGKSINKDTGMNVLIPNGKGPFPVLYMLHGLSKDCNSVEHWTDIERRAEPFPFMIVMPDGHRNFYTNDPRGDGLAYEDHIVKDVVGFIDSMFPSVANRRARAIGGMSMGGYGAMMLALRHPDLFSVVCSQSAAIFFAHDPKRRAPGGVQAFESYLPRGKYDCFTLARKHRNNPHRLAIRMECGTEDGLLEPNRQFHRHLEKLNIAHTYLESPGKHSSAYFADQLTEILQFVDKHLCGKKKGQ